MADQEYLASFGVQIDEGGVFRLQSVLAENRALAEELASAFDGAAASLQALREALGEDLPLLTGAGRGVTEGDVFGPGALRVGLDLTEANAGLEDFLEKAKQQIRLSANASAIVSAARTALSNVRSLFSDPVVINVVTKTTSEGGGEGGSTGEGSASADSESGGGQAGQASGGTTDLRMSSGGRFSRPTRVEIAEDGGTEYIIPVGREGRAVPLLRQLMSELSPGARESVVRETAPLPAVGEGSPEGASRSVPDVRDLLTGLSAAAPPAANVTQNHKNVSAPVTINVRAAGSDPERIGRSVYDAAERYLLKTLEA